MAEALAVVGAVSSTIQLLDFTTKIFDRLNHYLHRLDEVPGFLRGIRLYLPLFVEALRRTQFHIDHGHYNPMVSAVLKTFIDECNSEMILLDDILTKIILVQSDSKMQSIRKAVFSLKDEKKIKKIYSNLSGYIEKLLLFQSTVASDYTMVKMRQRLNLLEDSALSESSPIIATKSMENLVVDCKSRLDANVVSQKASKNFYCKDKKQYRASSFVGFYRFGLLWAFQVDLDISWGNYGFSINPALRMQRLVKYTSPGFEVFWKCHTNRLDIQSALAALFNLFSDGAVSPQDVDPDGRTLLERLLWFPYRRNHDMLITFLKMLCKWGAPMNTRISPLTLCAGWSGIGPHLTLLRELIALGYDLSADTYSSISLDFNPPFPEPFFGLREAYTDTPDPFLLRFFVECSKNAYGVWGQTPLMDAILCGSPAEITKFLQCTQSFHDKNIFGQTPIHLAVLRPSVLLSVLEVWPHFDLLDNSRRSPLVYAAAYGCHESVILLLKAGVEHINAQDLDFLDYARAWRHWNVVTKALRFFRATGCISDAILQSHIDRLMATYLHLSYQSRPEDFKILIDLGADPHFLFEDGDTLLHRLFHDAQINALFEAGFEYIDRPNFNGRTALMSSVSRFHCSLYSNILARGSNPNHQDNRGLSALHIACGKLNQEFLSVSCDSSYVLEVSSTRIALIARLLHHGADPLSHDNCRCPCSPNGCSPSTKLLLPRRSKDSVGYIWILEWLFMLREFQGELIAQTALVEMIRVIEFDRIGMTHVCCCRKAFCGPMEEEEIDEILEEEKDFVSDLDDTMQHLVQGIHNDAIEEKWLELVTGFHVPETGYEDTWSWATWQGGSSSASNGFNPPPWRSPKAQGLSNIHPKQASTASEGNQPHFWIDKMRDEFRSEQGPRTIRRIHRNRRYSAWVNYFHINHSSFRYPAQIHGDWYERRKYWALRQREMLG